MMLNTYGSKKPWVNFPGLKFYLYCGGVEIEGASPPPKLVRIYIAWIYGSCQQ